MATSWANLPSDDTVGINRTLVTGISTGACDAVLSDITDLNAGVGATGYLCFEPGVVGKQEIVKYNSVTALTSTIHLSHRGIVVANGVYNEAGAGVAHAAGVPVIIADTAMHLYAIINDTMTLGGVKTFDSLAATAAAIAALTNGGDTIASITADGIDLADGKALYHDGTAALQKVEVQSSNETDNGAMVYTFSTLVGINCLIAFAAEETEDIFGAGVATASASAAQYSGSYGGAAAWWWDGAFIDLHTGSTAKGDYIISDITGGVVTGTWAHIANSIHFTIIALGY